MIYSPLKGLALIFLLLTFWAQSQRDTIQIVSYNLLNFPEGRNDCSNNTVVVERADTLRKILQYLNPDIFVGCEIQTKAGADSVLTRSLNVNGVNHYSAATFDPLQTDAPLNNQLYYNSNKLTLQYQDVIITSPRNIDHYVLYMNDPNLGVYYDTTFIEVYMCHLKAGSGTTEQATRAVQTATLMNFIAQRPSDRHHFVCGDLNIYRSSEAAYQNLISGTAALVDPINSPGNWNSNSSFASIHTQSTRNGQNLDCGSQGGSDDRFDHIIVSSNVMSGSDSIKYIANTYKAIGNDGNHYNKSLLESPVNTMYPDSVVRALYYMSDHLPVAMKVEVVYPTSNGLALYPVIAAASCYGSNDGSATIVANDGQAPYSYLWDLNAGSQTTATALGLISGSYCVQVTDNLGQIDNYCVYVPQPDSISYSAFQSPDNGSCNGEAHIFPSGGTPPYTIVWNDPTQQTGNSAYNLCSGNYLATVTDGAGCISNVNFNILGINGIDDTEELAVYIHPNPFTEYLIISNETGNKLQFELIAINGQVLKSFVLSEQELSLDLHTLEKGVYYLKINSQRGTFIRSLIKM